MEFKHWLNQNTYNYPVIQGNKWKGLQLQPVGSTKSIDASLYDYKILNGIREIPFSQFVDPKHIFYAANDWQQARKLTQEIKNNNEIEPLIIVIDQEGPYILEGAHRFVALSNLGHKSFPALVVMDMDPT